MLRRHIFAAAVHGAHGAAYHYKAEYGAHHCQYQQKKVHVGIIEIFCLFHMLPLCI